MRIKKQRTTFKKNALIAAASAVVVLGVGALYLCLHPQAPEQSTVNSKNTLNAASESDIEQAKNLYNNPEVKQQNPNADKPAQPLNSDDSNKQQVQIVTSFNISNNTIYIRGGINYPVSGGTCYAELTGPSNQSIHKETSVLQNPASTDCKTISIPASELSPGEWTYTLNYTSTDYEGTSDENAFTI